MEPEENNERAKVLNFLTGGVTRYTQTFLLQVSIELSARCLKVGGVFTPLYTPWLCHQVEANAIDLMKFFMHIFEGAHSTVA